jgi:hypothetical protein
MMTYKLSYINLPGTYIGTHVRPRAISLTHMPRSSQCTDRNTATLEYGPVPQLLSLQSCVACEQSLQCRGDPSAVGGVDILSVHRQHADNAQNAVLSLSTARDNGGRPSPVWGVSIRPRRLLHHQRCREGCHRPGVQVPKSTNSPVFSTCLS